MAVSQLGYLGIGVKSLDKWEAYATEVLGLEVADRAPDGSVYLRMDEYHHRFTLLPNGRDDLAYIGWQTANRVEFEATKAKLLEGGVEYEQATAEEIANRHVVNMVKFDLSGVPSEVYYGPHVLFERPFKPSVAMTGFKTGELGLGHVGLGVNDLEEARHILIDCLDFTISDHLGAGERMFHCNPRQHTLGTAHFTPGPDAKRLAHFMVETNSIDDVGHCLDRCEDKGVTLRSRLGRHTNDHMISFYMWTPSGFSVEYGWGGRLIDDSKWQVNKYEKAAMWGHRRTPVTPTPSAPVAAAR